MYYPKSWIRIRWVLKAGIAFVSAIRGKKQFVHIHSTCIMQLSILQGLWKHFKMQGEPVNLREQQDALEFFMTRIENLDEALKHLGSTQVS